MSFCYNNQMELLVQKPYTKKSEIIAQELSSHLKNGLTETQAREYFQKIGPNELPKKRTFSVFKILFKQLKDFMILVLIAVALVSLLIHDIKDAVVIAAVVIINSFLGFFQEYKAEKTIEALKKTTSPQVKVIREGKYKIIPTYRIVPGDILIIEEGDIIQADGRLFESANVATQEAFLTGESTPISKTTHLISEKYSNIADQKNMIFRGSTVNSGHGKVLVTATGPNTELGKIAHLIQTIKDKPTPLEKKINILGKNLVLLTIILCLLVATIGILQGIPIPEMLKTAIVLGVACIPEGLVAVVTLALAFGVQRMARKKAVVRRLPAVETLGSVTIICSDKTGTLTYGKMTAQYVYANDSLIQVTGKGTFPKGDFLLKDEPVEPSQITELKLLLMISTLCNNAILQKKPARGAVTEWETFGEATEVSLKILAAKASVFEEDLLKEYQFFKEMPFDAKRKCMSKIYQKENAYFTFTKGAPEQILKLSTHEQIEGKIELFSEEKKQKIRKSITDWASKGFRVLGFAYRILKEEEKEIDTVSLESNLIFLGFVAMSDPLREEASDSLAKCHEAGIKTMILTGDHQNTATYIAKQLSVIQSENEVGNIQKLETLSETEFNQALQKYKVLSRVTPHLKLKIVEGLRAQGEIVAMTGDGINDAPAIKKANIGVAMGSGTDVAKEAADIVLMDDNFKTIVSSVEEGRTIYNNILKFIRYLLSCNMGEIFIMLFATLFKLPLPFLPIQILWLNLVTDTPPALALGVEPSSPGMMQIPPRHPKEPIFSKSVMNDILINGFIMALIILGIFIFELFWIKEDMAKTRTIVFATTAIIQLLHAFNCQDYRKSILTIGLFTNPYLIYAVLFSGGLILAGIYTPYLNDVFGYTTLNGMDWLYVNIFAFMIIFAVEIQKYFRRKNHNK